MCGIGGQFLHNDEFLRLEVLNAMAMAMLYRGPDHEGIYRAGYIGLVHRRLSIPDLGAAGHCPKRQDKATHLWLILWLEFWFRLVAGKKQSALIGFQA